MSAMNYNDNFKEAIAQNVNAAGGSTTEVEDTGIDMGGCNSGVLLVNMAIIAGGSLVIKVEDDHVLAGTYGTTCDGDGETTITTAVLTAIEVNQTERYWRIVYTDSADTKTWSAVFVGWNSNVAPL